ncbi:hypothetical protein C8R45DRAFT_1038610, partial [Mycena sanguinolenta]
ASHACVCGPLLGVLFVAFSPFFMASFCISWFCTSSCTAFLSRSLLRLCALPLSRCACAFRFGFRATLSLSRHVSLGMSLALRFVFFRSTPTPTPFLLPFFGARLVVAFYVLRLLCTCAVGGVCTFVSL